MKPYIVTLTGPSCAGKSHLENLLTTTKGFARAISTTTREPRAGEIDGVHYYFINKTRFIALLEEGRLVEHVEFDGQFYGVTAEEIERLAISGKPVVIVVEPWGRAQIRNYCARRGWECHSVYVGNPDQVIAERFMVRCIDEFCKTSVEEAPKLKDRHARRLATMMTTERAWVAEAFFQIDNDGKVYDRLLTFYNEDNDKTVAESILQGFCDSLVRETQAYLAA